MLAGAAGLRIAAGILFPGMLRRKDALALAGLEAVQLVAGTIPLLTIAGTLEAFLSPTHAPNALKFGVGALLFAGLCPGSAKAAALHSPALKTLLRVRRCRSRRTSSGGRRAIGAR